MWPENFGIPKSIPWLLMPWLLASPSHQQPWCWLCAICIFLSSMRIHYNTIWHVSVEKWNKMQIYFYAFPKKILRNKALKCQSHNTAPITWSTLCVMILWHQFLQELSRPQAQKPATLLCSIYIHTENSPAQKLISTNLNGNLLAPCQPPIQACGLSPYMRPVL